MSFIKLNRLVSFLSGFSTGRGIPEAPADFVSYSRKDGNWKDVFNIVAIVDDLPVTALNFSDSSYQTLTGNYSAVDVPEPALSNTPWELVTGATYSFVIEIIRGPDGAKQQNTCRSNLWEGDRVFFRTADSGVDIVTTEWKEVLTVYSEIGSGSTNDVNFNTILTHTLEDDTTENLEMLVYGTRTSGGFAKALFSVSAFCNNIGGTSTVLGFTSIYEHTNMVPGVVAVQVIDNGTADVLIQVRGTNDDWDWRVENHFNELRI